MTSKYKGVSYTTTTGKFKAYVRHNGVQIQLGQFVEEIDAAKEVARAQKQIDNGEEVTRPHVNVPKKPSIDKGIIPLGNDKYKLTVYVGVFDSKEEAREERKRIERLIRKY